MALVELPPSGMKRLKYDLMLKAGVPPGAVKQSLEQDGYLPNSYGPELDSPGQQAPQKPASPSPKMASPSPSRASPSPTRASPSPEPRMPSAATKPLSPARAGFPSPARTGFPSPQSRIPTQATAAGGDFPDSDSDEGPAIEGGDQYSMSGVSEGTGGLSPSKNMKSRAIPTPSARQTQQAAELSSQGSSAEYMNNPVPQPDSPLSPDRIKDIKSNQASLARLTFNKPIVSPAIEQLGQEEEKSKLKSSSSMFNASRKKGSGTNKKPPPAKYKYDGGNTTVPSPFPEEDMENSPPPIPTNRSIPPTPQSAAPRATKVDTFAKVNVREPIMAPAYVQTSRVIEVPIEAGSVRETVRTIQSKKNLPNLPPRVNSKISMLTESRVSANTYGGERAGNPSFNGAPSVLASVKGFQKREDPSILGGPSPPAPGFPNIDGEVATINDKRTTAASTDTWSTPGNTRNSMLSDEGMDIDVDEPRNTIVNGRKTGVSVANTRNTGIGGANVRNTAVSAANTRNTAVSAANTRNTGVSAANTRNTGVSVDVSVANTRNTAVSVANTRNTGVSAANTRNTGVSVGVSVANTRNTGVSVDDSVANTRNTAATGVRNTAVTDLRNTVATGVRNTAVTGIRNTVATGVRNTAITDIRNTVAANTRKTGMTRTRKTGVTGARKTGVTTGAETELLTESEYEYETDEEDEKAPRKPGVPSSRKTGGLTANDI